MNFHSSFIIILLFILLSSCSFFSKNGKESPIAKVHDNYLYPSDIEGMIPAGTSSTDSTQIVQNYVQNWIRKNLVIEKAELNLTSEQKDVEKQLEEYRTSLIIYAYQKEYIRQYLDTVVSLEEIESYYNNHKNDFILKDNIVDIAYVKFRLDAKKIDKAKKWFASDKEEDLLTLEDFCYSNAIDFSFKKENWMALEVVSSIVPVELGPHDLKIGIIIEAKDSAAYYMVKINDYKLKNTIPPLSFEIESIRNIIINKRKLKLIEGLEHSLYKTALANKEFEVY